MHKSNDKAVLGIAVGDEKVIPINGEPREEVVGIPVIDGGAITGIPVTNDVVTEEQIEELFRTLFTFEENLTKYERPDPKSPTYLPELAILKDKIDREKNGKPQIFSMDPSEYCKLLFESLDLSCSEEITNGLKCGKCGKMSAFRTAEQRRAGDEGQSMVLKCSIKSCGFTKLLSN